MVHRVSILVLFALLLGCRAEVTDSDQETGIKPLDSDQEIGVQPLVNNATEISIERTEGWSSYGTRQFKFISTARTWAESERYCVLLKGNLASVHSAEEYYFIQDVVLTHTHDTPFTWIGGCDAAQEALWLWSDGSRFDYSHWRHAQPDNANGVEHCAHINAGGSLRWNDYPCNRLLPSVCSKER